MRGRCRVLPLELDRHSVRFRWELQPSHPVWTRNDFTLEYEADIDLTAMPRALLWTVFLGCTHAIWALLDGYEVEFTEFVGADELEFWGRMVAASRSAAGLLARGESPVLRQSVAEAGQAIRPPVACEGPSAVVLSCGKESLLSLGLLREARGAVVAVNVDSPMPGSQDHESTFRAWALDAIGNAPGVTLRRVRSDLRAAWKNDHALTVGGIASVNELADCFIYPSLALPIAYQHRLPWVALGSEWGEHHVPLWTAEGWQFDRYFSLAGVGIAAISRLWRDRYGVGYTSVIQPISQYLVEQILLQRYPDLAAFQHSCYRASRDVRACQCCEKCLRVTALALAAGTDPSVIGMDVNKVFSRRNATAVQLEEGSADTHYASMNHLIRFALGSIDGQRADPYFSVRGIGDVVKLRPWRARRRFHRRLAKVGSVDPGGLDTVKRGYLRYLPDDLQTPIRTVLEASAPYDREDDDAVHVARAKVYATLTEPLGAPGPGG
jgi:hypothetical protein